MSTRRIGRLVLAAVALVFTVAGVSQAWTDSPTVDEGVDLASGLSAWVHHDLRMVPEHPVLPRLLAAAPALAADPIVPEGPAWEDGDWFDHTDDVLRANDEAGRLRRVVFLSRLVPLAEVLGVAAALFVLARRWAGEGAGLLAAGAWLAMPMVLALGHVQSIDVAFTLTTLLTVVALARHRDQPTVGRAVWVGVALAAGLGTRHSALVLVPVALLLVGLSAPSTRAARIRQVGVAAVVGWLGVWLLYRGFDPTPVTGPPAERFDGLVGAAGARSLLVRVALAVPMPQEWQAGLAHLTLTSDARPAYLFGRAWDGTTWWYFPGSLVATAPMAVLALLVGGAVGWLRRAPTRLAGPAGRRDALLLGALPAGVLLVFTMAQPLALGLRLVFPPLALGVALAAAGAARLVPPPGERSRPILVVVVAVVLVVQAGVLVPAGRHAFAWQPLAFRPGYQVVSDSNLDFGQDLWRVRTWSASHDRPWVAVIAPRGLEPGPGTRDLWTADPGDVTGWVAVGATALTVVGRAELEWLRAYCPVGRLGGGSVLLYRFDEPPTDGPGPDRPVGPCWGEEVSRRTA